MLGNTKIKMARLTVTRDWLCTLLLLNTLFISALYSETYTADPVVTEQTSGTEIDWISPVEGASFSEADELYVELGATDNGSISNVRLYLDDHFVRQENIADYEWDSYKDSELANLAVSPHRLRAEVTDDDDNVTTSSINFTVEASDSAETPDLEEFPPISHKLFCSYRNNRGFL
jgi:hypothetical protein